MSSISIKSLRESAGLTQTELANRSGLAQAAISQYESGKRVCSSTAAAQLARALSIPLKDLWGFQLEPSADPEKDAAIAILSGKLRHPSVSVREIEALIQLFEGRG